MKYIFLWQSRVNLYFTFQFLFIIHISGSYFLSSFLFPCTQLFHSLKIQNFENVGSVHLELIFIVMLTPNGWSTQRILCFVSGKLTNKLSKLWFVLSFCTYMAERYVWHQVEFLLSPSTVSQRVCACVSVRIICSVFKTHF